MKIYLSKTHSDEDNPEGVFAESGKLGIIYSDQQDLMQLCNFFEDVKKELEHTVVGDPFHLHFRDFLPNWNKSQHIDLEINLIKEET